jgi:hypothetical protein
LKKYENDIYKLRENKMSSLKEGRKYTLALVGVSMAFILVGAVLFFHPGFHEAQPVLDLIGKFFMFGGSIILGYLGVNGVTNFMKK